ARSEHQEMRKLFAVLLAAAGALAQQQRPRFVLPDDVGARKVDIMSEGVRMAGEVYALQSAAGRKLPTIIMSHGWGGTVAGLRRDAAGFAQSGYLVGAFDYPGWGASDSRGSLTGPGPAGNPAQRLDE